MDRAALPGQCGAMGRTIELPLWLLVLILLFAAVTFASHFLFPSVRWFFRRRLERAVARLNERLERPISPFKLLRRHDMVLRLTYDSEVARAIDAHVAQTGEREDVAYERARRYAREIVPRFSADIYYGVGLRIARGLARLFYHVEAPAGPALADVGRDDTVIFVINHRSNMDYVLVTWLAERRSALAYAVGEWARVWPLSWLIRSMGAYFIRRRSRDDLYRKVLARYVQMASQGGLTQAMFPEGGLSLTGAPQEPRMGLLSYIIESIRPEGAEALADGTRDVAFVPVGLNYDRVLEDQILIAAAAEGTRRFRFSYYTVARYLLRRLWLKLRGRLVPVGSVQVCYGRPVSLKALLANGAETEDVATKLMARVAAVIPVLPVPLVARALLDEGGEATREALVARCAELRESLPEGVACPEPALAVERALALWNLRGVATGAAPGAGGRVAICPGEEPLFAYYAASIAHHLPPATR